jgi:hypothetical protein
MVWTLSHRRDRLIPIFAAALFDLLVAAHFALNFVRLGAPFLDLEKFISGSEKFPFQYRILTAPIYAVLSRAFANVDFGRVLPHLPDYLASAEALSYFAITWASFFIALLLFRRIAAELFAGSAAIAAYFLFLALSYLWFILNPSLSFVLPYDLPALAFCEASLFCVLRGRWNLLSAVFIFATLNRETSYLIVLFLLVRGYLGDEKSHAFFVAAILGALWLVLKLALILWFWPASGGLIIAGLRIGYNLAILAKPWQWPTLWPLLLPVAVSVWACRIAAARPWSMTATIGFLSLFCVANITELRAYGDLIPFVVLAMVAATAHKQRPELLSLR